MCRAPESVASKRFWGFRTWSSVGASGTDVVLGIVAFEMTLPLFGSKYLTKESVPAEYIADEAC